MQQTTEKGRNVARIGSPLHRVHGECAAATQGMRNQHEVTGHSHLSGSSRRGVRVAPWQDKSVGGSVIDGPRGGAEQGRFAVIRDPAGAHLALHQAP